MSDTRKLRPIVSCEIEQEISVLFQQNRIVSSAPAIATMLGRDPMLVSIALKKISLGGQQGIIEDGDVYRSNPL